MSFDFFFTHPYQSLKIDSSDDIQTTVLLLVIGLVVAELVTFARRHRSGLDAARRRDHVRLHRVAELVATDSDAEDVVLSVQAELIGLLSLRDCRYETAPYTSELPRARAQRRRRRRPPALGRHRATPCPTQGAVIPVLGRGREFGRLVLVPDLTVGVSIEERRGGGGDRRPARRRVRGRLAGQRRRVRAAPASTKPDGGRDQPEPRRCRAR